jgi:hypothetical protein
MSDNGAGTVEVIAIQIGRFFAPVRRMLADHRRIELFVELGMRFPPELDDDATFGTAADSVMGTLGALPGLAEDLLATVQDNPGAAIDKLNALLDGISAAVSGFASLANTLNAVGKSLGVNSADVDAFTVDLGPRLFDWAAITYIEGIVPELAALLDVFGVIERSEQQVGSTDPLHPQFTQKTLHFSALPRALLSPVGALGDLYDFGKPTFDGKALFARLESVLSLSGIPVFFDSGASPPMLDVVFAELSADTTVSPPGLAVDFKVQFSDQNTLSIPPISVKRTLTLGPVGSTLSVRPNLELSLKAPAASTSTGQLEVGVEIGEPDSPIVLVGHAEGSRLEVHTFAASATANLTFDAARGSSDGNFAAELDLRGVHLLVEPNASDGFLSSIVPARGIDSRFDIGLRLTPSGIAFTGSAGLTLVLPLHLDIGIAKVDAVSLGVNLGSAGALTIPLSANVRGQLGPVGAVIEGLGVQGVFEFPGSGGNVGPIDASLAPLTPTGVGISVDAGAIRGGGFLSFAGHRYSGAIELSVYGVAVKAFGLIETVLPGGRKGFSFAIVISAEFTAIQLGFGFTLLGVGGLLGINRSLNDDGLSSAVRSGSLENILFPHNPDRDAPAIIHDLATIFPAAPGHYVLGPMAKLGWGTPTLIDAELGIILELPGPRLAILGVVHMALPTRNAALLTINLAVAGSLDFPKKLFSIDASLYDSQVVGFTIRGDMAFRLSFGDEPNFALSIGGLHPSYQPPPGFPELRRVSIDLGINGNPSLTASGYFALTSNTAQVGAAIDLHASGFGIDLDGHLGFDALFVFSPFSFVAGFSAGVSVSFHGVGLGVGLNGTISGPTPWHVSAEACVSILFWDACLPIDISFGTNQRAELPPMDPWLGHDDADATNVVVGLRTAIEKTTNWAGGFPPGAHPVVTLTEDPKRTDVPIDPVGQATLHQKVVPLNYQLTRFGIYKPAGPVGHTQFQTASMSVAIGAPPNPLKLVKALRLVQDQFAPALFKDMGDAEKLSAQPYQPFDSGFTLDPDAVTSGDAPFHEITFDTEIIDDQRNSTMLFASFQLTDRHLTAMAASGPAALNGIRAAGAQRFVDPEAPKLISVSHEVFVISDACSATANLPLTGGVAVAQTTAQNTLDAHLADQPSDRGRFRVIPSYLAA